MRSRVHSSEIHGYLVAKTLENQMNSINTLKSLSSLLTKISQIVIEEKIAKEKIAKEVMNLCDFFRFNFIFRQCSTYEGFRA